MLILLITETSKNEPSRFNLYNNISYKLKTLNYELEILTFLKDSSKNSNTFRKLNLKTFSSYKTNIKIINIFIFLYYLIRKRPKKLFIGGYGHIEHWIALIFAKLLFIDIILWTGASTQTTLSKSKLKTFLKNIFVNRFKVAITYGTNSANYLKEIGYKNEINKVNNVSDVESFISFRKIYTQTIDYKKRRKIHSNQFIFCGRLEKSKGCLELIKCFKRLNKKKYFLNIVGSGTLENLFINAFKKKIINGRFYGKLDQIYFAKVMISSDYYIMPTLNDPFTRTLSEALACKTFPINSRYDDAIYDLIKNQKNGIIFDPKNSNDFYKKINLLLNNKKKNNYFLNNNLFNTKLYSDAFIKAVL